MLVWWKKTCLQDYKEVVEWKITSFKPFGFIKIKLILYFQTEVSWNVNSFFFLSYMFNVSFSDWLILIFQDVG